MTLSSRDIVLNRIRAATSSARQEGDLAAVHQRLASSPPLTRPSVSGDLIERFVQKALANACTVDRLASAADIVPAIERVITERGLVRRIGASAQFASLSWPSSLVVENRAGLSDDAVCLTDASAGISETGSLVFFSSSERPAGLNFLPETHIAVLHTRDIVRHIEDIWPKARALAVWPRAVNIVSGPSRTADVAQIIVRPAHGPKSLHILMLEEP